MLEQLYITEDFQDIALSRCEKINKDKYLYWIISINDFEKLFLLLKNDENKFNSIINKKIILEKNRDKNGRGFDKLLFDYKNEYVLNDINYYDIFLKI